MTTLRDDGDLETDDAVVKACFLGHPVRRFRGGKWINDILGRIEIHHLPILIPASVVAEVCGYPGNPDEVLSDTAYKVRRIFLTAINQSPGAMTAWLRTHTQETP